jgi:ABC-type multidrug transport system permease subunit
MTYEYSDMVQYLLLAAAVLTILLPFYGGRLGIPVFFVLGRWIRWVLFAALFAYFLKVFGLSFRPDWVHFLS